MSIISLSYCLCSFGFVGVIIGDMKDAVLELADAIISKWPGVSVEGLMYHLKRMMLDRRVVRGYGPSQIDMLERIADNKDFLFEMAKRAFGKLPHTGERARNVGIYIKDWLTEIVREIDKRGE